MAPHEAARSETVREVKFCAATFDDVTLRGRFEGYASVFHKRDLGSDVVMPGAFRDSLLRRGTRDIKMLFQHDSNQPIGVWESIHEDARGLYVRGRILTEVGRGREILSMMRAGAIDGLSIGFKVQRSKRDPHSRVRQLLQVDLWEISIVTFPMLPEARVETIKGLTFQNGAPTAREFERWLTRDAGLTRSQARALMRDGLKGLKHQRDAGSGQETVARLTQQITEAARLLRETMGKNE